MNASQARALARQWVTAEASRLPGFAGAYTAGSVNWLSDTQEHPATSDVDIKVVLDRAELPESPGKFVYKGTLLDASFVAVERLRTAEGVLGDYHLAAGLCTPSLLADPTGDLAQLQRAVAAGYAKQRWVERRCAHARVGVLSWISRIRQARLYHDQVTCWLFAAGGMAHVVLVAGLDNPTIRRRYYAAQRILARYGYLDFHEVLLAGMGCAQLDRACVEHHLSQVEKVFDFASEIIATPYRFAGDISSRGRRILVDGSRELIDQGFHREAVFWLVATYSRCQAVLHNDATPEMRKRYDRGYGELLSDLGIRSFDDLVASAEKMRDVLPRLDEVIETIVATNAGVEG